MNITPLHHLLWYDGPRFNYGVAKKVVTVNVVGCLSKRLNPMGWMVVYQRVWTAGVNPAGALQYEKNGWLISQQPRFDYYTYRAGTGATWFNDQADECGLEPYPTKTEKNFTS